MTIIFMRTLHTLFLIHLACDSCVELDKLGVTADVLLQKVFVCSLFRLLVSAKPTSVDVAAALSNTLPSFTLGLPGLTKLICDCSKRGEHAKALAVFQAAPALGLSPDRPLCNAAIHAAGRGGDASAASAIVLYMLQNGIRPDAVTYRSAVETLSKHSNIDVPVWVRGSGSVAR
jgi:pentatricopeptide repeat protein